MQGAKDQTGWARENREIVASNERLFD